MLQLLKNKKSKIEKFNGLVGKYEDIEAILELSGEDDDESLAQEALNTEKELSVGISPEFYRTVTGSVLSRDVEDGAGVRFEDFLSK